MNNAANFSFIGIVDGNALKARRRRGKNEARGAATATFSAWHVRIRGLLSPTSLLTVISPIDMAGLALAIFGRDLPQYVVQILNSHPMDTAPTVRSNPEAPGDERESAL
jgi:hypothetical protein